MKPYELTVLLHPDLEIDIDAPIAKVEKLIKSAGGTIAKRDNWGKRRLAYKVNKQSFAVYVYFDLLLPSDGPAKLEGGLRITEEVMRFLIVKHEEPAAPKPEVKEEEKSGA